MKTYQNFINWTITLCLSFCLFNTAIAQEEELSLNIAVAYEGYSLVSYFTENKAEKGSEEFSYILNNNAYYFTSEKQLKMFKKNPAKYAPRYDFCSYGISVGKQLSLDPEKFKVVDGSLLLFHRSENFENDDIIDGLSLWNQEAIDEDIEMEMLRRADLEYQRLVAPPTS